MFSLHNATELGLDSDICMQYSAWLIYNKTSVSLDYEDSTVFGFLNSSLTRPHAYRLAITVTDDDEDSPLSSTGYVQVNVTDVAEAPTFTSTVAFSVSEDTESETSIADLDDRVTDEDYYDTDGTRLFHVKAATASGPISAAFNILCRLGLLHELGDIVLRKLALPSQIT